MQREIPFDDIYAKYVVILQQRLSILDRMCDLFSIKARFDEDGLSDYFYEILGQYWEQLGEMQVPLEYSVSRKIFFEGHDDVTYIRKGMILSAKYQCKLLSGYGSVFIGDLPNEILCMIIDRLNEWNRKALRKTCRKFAKLIYAQR